MRTAIPPGYYADPILDQRSDNPDDPEYCEVVGYRLFEVNKRGVKRFRISPVDGIDRTRLLAVVEWERDFYGDDSDRIDSALSGDPSDYRWMQELYGQLTGRCGACGRALTDPESKMRGLGPECAKGDTAK